MKAFILCCAVSLAIVSCSSNQNKQSKTDTVVVSDTMIKTHSTTVQINNAPTASSLCFLHTEGKNNQDSTSIELVIKGSKVNGQMNWLPYQKDSRKGKLDGVIAGDTIKATWTFMQEGMTDTLGLKFKLDKDQLTQKPLKLNIKTGREQTDESADYRLVYESSNKLKK
jgi:hypothetical protein